MNLCVHIGSNSILSHICISIKVQVIQKKVQDLCTSLCQRQRLLTKSIEWKFELMFVSIVAPFLFIVYTIAFFSKVIACHNMHQHMILVTVSIGVTH